MKLIILLYEDLEQTWRIADKFKNDLDSGKKFCRFFTKL